MEKRNSYLISKAFKSFLLASLLTVAATQVGATVDGMMLSYLIGEQAMSSVNICRPIMQSLFSLCMLFGAGSSMLVGVAIGNRNREEANRIFTSIMTLVVIIGILFLIIGLVWLNPLVNILCSDIGLRSVTSEFLGITLYGAIFYMLSTVLEMFVTVDGNPKRVTLAVLVSSITNLFLDYIFIAIFGWGVSGAALATVISYIVPIGILIPHFIRANTLRINFNKCFSLLPKSVMAGLPFGIATMLIAVQMWGNNNIAMIYMGQSGIIALSVCLYLLGLSMIILTGTLKAFQPVASILKGAGDEQGVLMVIRKAYNFMFVCLVVFVLPMILCPQWVAKVFGISDTEILSVTTTAIPAFSINIVFQCVVYLLVPIYQLYGNKAMATFVSIGQSLAPMFGMWFFAVFAPKYVWWGFALGQVIIALFVITFSIIKQSHNKQLTPLVLVPHKDISKGFETSLLPNIDALSRLLIDIDKFLKAHIHDTSLIMHIEVSSEELIKNIITHGYTEQYKKRYIDYRLSILSDSICVVISDDARAFNPVEYDKETGLGLLLVKGLCKDIKYDYLFHQNITKITYPLSTDI